MENLFKKFVYTGVGFVSLTTDRMKETVKGLIEDGKISEEEGKKIFEDFNKNKDTKKEEFESQMKSIFDKILKSFNFATSTDIEKMENRISVLEGLLAKLEDKEKAEPKKTTRKTPKKDDKNEK